MPDGLQTRYRVRLPQADAGIGVVTFWPASKAESRCFGRFCIARLRANRAGQVERLARMPSLGQQSCYPLRGFSCWLLRTPSLARRARVIPGLRPYHPALTSLAKRLGWIP